MTNVTTQSADRNKAVIRRVMEEVWNKGDLKAVDELYAPDYVDHEKGPGGPGREGVKRTVSAFRAAFPDLHGTVEDLIAEGDKVAFRYSAAGTHEGDLMGIPPTNRRVTMEALAIVRMVDGKIAEGWGQFDRAGLMQQLGVLPDLAKRRAA